jgi:2-methylcitrate dehydratase PrpD
MSDPLQKAPPLIAAQLAEHAANWRHDLIPPKVRERASHLMLDALGIGYASTQFDFAQRACRALSALARADTGADAAAGGIPVIGMGLSLPLRDAVLANGILVHGLDYDDTHIGGVLHTTASAFPLALGLAAQRDASGRDLLAAFVLATEISARIGIAANGGFHHAGFHPTGVAGTFGCTLAAGWLSGLSAAQMLDAQGIALSVAAGSLEFLQDGAWTKRMHPGWAGVGALTASALAREGYAGPHAAYEGRYGLYKLYLGSRAGDFDPRLATHGLGSTWELDAVAIKPFPACHFTHGCADAALALHAKGLRATDVSSIEARLPVQTMPVVCEPIANKLRPANAYDAQFSVPYIVAACLVRGRFGLAELEHDALTDPAILALAARVNCVADPAAEFPRYYSGELLARTHDGRNFTHREHANRGCVDRPISNEDVRAKFIANATRAISRERAEAVMRAMLDIEQASSARALAHELCNSERSNPDG